MTCGSFVWNDFGGLLVCHLLRPLICWVLVYLGLLFHFIVVLPLGVGCLFVSLVVWLSFIVVLCCFNRSAKPAMALVGRLQLYFTAISCEKTQIWVWVVFF